MKLMSCNIATQLLALFCIALLAPGDSILVAQQAPQPQPPGPADNSLLSAAELESLVAPLALYPDQLVAQALAASTYPLEIVEADRWVRNNKSLQGDALVKAAAQKNWEPSVQAMVLFPTLLQQMDQNLTWTTALGNAFLAQQEDTMAAIQRLRKKAQAQGALQSNAQQTVEQQQVDGAQVITIQPANPEVVYLPAYDPTQVYGAAPAYAPYPPIVYPSTGAAVATGLVSFGTGIAMGALLNGWHGGGWGWGCNWGPRPSLYVNNTFINRYGFRGPAYTGRTGNAAWAHNPVYRGAAPYSNAKVANRYGNPQAGKTFGTGAAAGVRGPSGAAGAVATPRGTAARTPNGAAGAINTPRGNPAGMKPNAPAGAISSPKGSAARVAPNAGSPAVPQGTFTNQRPNPFGGGGAQTRMNSQRGGSSMGRGGGGRMGGGRRR